MRTAWAYEASKQDGPRGEAKNEARGETLRRHDETREQAADTASRPEIVFSSPQIGKKTRAEATRSYNGFKQTRQGKNSSQMKGTR